MGRVVDDCRPDETPSWGYPDVGAATTTGDLGGGSDGESIGELLHEFGIPVMVRVWTRGEDGLTYFSRIVFVLVNTSPYMSKFPQLSAAGSIC